MSRFVQFSNVAEDGKFQHCPGGLLRLLLLNVPPDGREEIFCRGDVVFQLEIVSAKTSSVVDEEGVIQVLLGAEGYPFRSIIVVPL